MSEPSPSPGPATNVAPDDKAPNPEDESKAAISALTAAFAASVTFFIGAFTGLAPPDEEGMRFFLPLCIVVGLLVSFVMHMWRTGRLFLYRFTFRRYMIVFIAAAIVGLIAIGAYIRESGIRVTRNGDDKAVAVTKELNLSSEGMNYIWPSRTERDLFGDCGTIESTSVSTSWSCARAAARHLSLAYGYMFKTEALRSSRSILTVWYCLGAACLILAVYLALDQFIIDRRRKSRLNPQQPGGPAAPAAGASASQTPAAPSVALPEEAGGTG
jgi:hypothetical protein